MSVTYGKATRAIVRLRAMYPNSPHVLRQQRVVPDIF